MPDSLTAWDAAVAGQRSIEHLTGVRIACSSEMEQLKPKLFGPATAAGASRWAVIRRIDETYNPEQCQRLFSKFKSNDTWQVPTLTVLRAMSHLDEPAFTSDPRVQFVPPGLREIWNPANDFRFRTYDFSVSREKYDLERRIVGEMLLAGVPMMAGTDVLNPYCFPGFSLHDELAILVEIGVTPLSALQMATINPAIFMHATEQYGSVAVEKTADLVLLDADPLKDIHNTTKISSVFFGGRQFDRKALNDLLKAGASAAQKSKTIS